MATIQFGYVITADIAAGISQAAYLDAVNRALEMVSGVFDSAWMIDHLQFTDMPLLEGLSSIAYFSALHPRLKFGNTVLCQSFRNPAHLAKIAATLQFLTGGRFILGLGAGWHEEEYLAYGYPFPSRAARVEQLEETVQIIRALWSGAPATFEGKHYRVEAARCEPRPDPQPPILIGASRPKMLRLAARYADEWNVSSSGLTRYQRQAGFFDEACEAVGRDPAQVARSWVGGIACAATQAEAEALAGDRFSAQAEEGDFGFVGTPAQVAAQMRSFIELGVNRFYIDCMGFSDLTCLRRVMEEVYPALQV